MIKAQGVILINFLSAGHGQVLLHAHNSVPPPPPPPDPTMTVDNVTQVLNKIPEDKWIRVMDRYGGGLEIPEPLLKEIQRRYSTDTEKIHACADYYVNCHPDSEWEHLTARLYLKKEFALARESKSFMLTGKNTTTIYSIATDAVYVEIFAGRKFSPISPPMLSLTQINFYHTIFLSCVKDYIRIGDNFST